MQYWHNTVQKHIEEHYDKDDKIKVCEIGLYHAEHTELLLKNYPNIELVGVDPSYHENIGKLQDQYINFIFHQDTSLNILPDYNDFDVVLIDGDHNYYTVYNELSIIYETHKEWPLIILHDTHHPWGRQDFTYNQSTIPEGEYNKPGRSGVRTAVEDWLEEHNNKDSRFKLSLYMHGPGLGVIEWTGDNI